MSEKPTSEMSPQELETEINRLKRERELETQTVEERCRADWDADPAIRAEFREFEIFLAFKEAEASGQVKIIGGVAVTI